MAKLLLTFNDPEKVKAGVETYSKLLLKVFPDLKIIHLGNIGAENKDFFSLIKEPMKAKLLGDYVVQNKEVLKPELVITNGMIGWNLTEKKVGCGIVNLQHGTYAAYAKAAMKKTGLNYWRIRYIYSYFERFAAKNASTIISNSKFTANNVKKHYGRDSKTVYPPIDINLFKPLDKKECRKKLNLPLDKKIILFVGRPDYSKGFDIFEKIAEKMPEHIFVSVTNPKAKTELPNFLAFDEIKHEDLVYFYNSADVLLFPSRFEGFGFVPLEALACNLPVIANNVGIFDDFTNEIPNTFILNNKDITFHINCINKLTGEKTFKDSRKFIEKNLSLKLFIEKHDEIGAIF